MGPKSALATHDSAKASQRSALESAAQAASTSCGCELSPEVLGAALRTGVMPVHFELHIRALLDEAPLLLLNRVVGQICAELVLPADQVWTNIQCLAMQLKIAREISVPAMLEERQARHATDVVAGRRSARSLWAFQPGDLDGYTFTPLPTSEYDKPGDGW